MWLLQEKIGFALICHGFLLSLVGHLFFASSFVTSDSITALRCRVLCPHCPKLTCTCPGLYIPEWRGSLGWGTVVEYMVCSWSASCRLSWGWQEVTGAHGRGHDLPLTYLTVWLVCEECRESSRAPIGSLEPPMVKGPVSQYDRLWWWEGGCQSGSWMLRQKGSLNRQVVV